MSKMGDALTGGPNPLRGLGLSAADVFDAYRKVYGPYHPLRSRKADVMMKLSSYQDPLSRNTVYRITVELPDRTLRHGEFEVEERVVAQSQARLDQYAYATEQLVRYLKADFDREHLTETEYQDIIDLLEQIASETPQGEQDWGVILDKLTRQQERMR